MFEGTKFSQSPKIAIYLKKFGGGGIPRKVLIRAKEFLDRGYRVDLVVHRGGRPSSEQIPNNAQVVEIQPGSRIKALYLTLSTVLGEGKKWALPVVLSFKGFKEFAYIPGLINYFISNPPDVLISNNTFRNLCSIWARKLSQVSFRLIVEQPSNISTKIANKKIKYPYLYRLPDLIGFTYPQADRIVTVSEGVANDLVKATGIAREKITRINSPVVLPEFINKAINEPPPHHWLEQNSEISVIVACGRLGTQKNFRMLLRAFAKLRENKLARLIILGEGPERAKLQKLIRKLGIHKDVALPGFASNPYTAFCHADLFVLSSDYEGFPGVLVEALACGCPVVSTNCPSGPDEILDGGRYGELVPVGDDEAMAKAMQTLWKILRRSKNCATAPHISMFIKVLKNI